MLRRTTLLAAVLAVAALAVPGTAHAGPVDDAVAGLRTDHLYVAPQATTRFDQAAVRAAIGDAPLRIAVLAAGPGVDTVRQWPRKISAQLPDNTIAVISGRYFYAGSDVLARGVAGLAATHAIARHKDALRQNASSDITQVLMDFVAEIKAAPPAAGREARGGRYSADEPGGGESAAVGTDDTGRTWPLVAGGAVLALLLAAGSAVAVRRRTGRRSHDRRAEVAALLARLAAELPPDRLDQAGAAATEPAGATGEAAEAGSGAAGAATAGAPDRITNVAAEAAAVEGDLGGLDIAAGASTGVPPAATAGVAEAGTGTSGTSQIAGAGRVEGADRAGRAMADAVARHATAEALLAGASTDRQYDEARHLVIEGLTAARVARGLRGEPAGAPVPPFDPAPDPKRPDPVAQGADALRPASGYTPETPYYHPGRFGVPAGWYPVRIPATGAFAVPGHLPAEPTGTSHGTR